MTVSDSTLTWGQSSEYHHLLKNGFNFPGAVLADIWPILPGVSGVSINRALRSLVSRHETLRTEFRHDPVDGRLDRRHRRAMRVDPIVHDGDQLDFDVLSTSTSSVAEHCRELVAAARSQPHEPERFDRRIVARVVGSPSEEQALVVRTPHITVDHVGLVALKDEFASVIRHGSTGHLGVAAQPSEQGLIERSSLAQRRSVLSARYVQSVLATAPDALLTRPSDLDGASRASVVSAAAASAGMRLAERFRTSVPTVLLAAAGVLLRIRADSSSIAFRSPFIGRPYRVSRCVAPQNLPAFIAFTAPEDASLADLVRSASVGAVRGYRSSGLDPDMLTAVEIAEEDHRAFRLSGYCQFNYLGSPDPNRIMGGDGAAYRPPAGTTDEERKAFLSQDYQFVMNVAGGYVAGALDIRLTVADGFIGRSAQSCLRSYGRILERMADDRPTTVGDLMDAA